MVARGVEATVMPISLSPEGVIGLPGPLSPSSQWPTLHVRDRGRPKSP
jgi:hypothetical protein